MSEAPERLVLELRQGMTFDAWTECRDPRYAKSEPVEYVRADRIEELVATCEELEVKLVKVIAAYRIEAMRWDGYSHDAFDRHIAQLKEGRG